MVEDSNAEENQGFNNKMKQMKQQKATEWEKQAAGRQKDWSTVNMNSRDEDTKQRISTGLQTQGDYIGRQTRVTMETSWRPLKQ